MRRCRVCGCRFYPNSIKQFVCWDCIEDHHYTGGPRCHSPF
jgi:hypothetical protein